jgi:membrane peptidoglycan carboxypeptidase
MGNPDGEIPMTNVGGTGPVFGAGYPAKIWRHFMLDANGPLPVVNFPPPDVSAFRSRYLTELGRQTSYISPYQTPTSTVPTTTPTTVATVTTAPPVTPTTKPKHHPPPPTPKTTPPTTAPIGP